MFFMMKKLFCTILFGLCLWLFLNFSAAVPDAPINRAIKFSANWWTWEMEQILISEYNYVESYIENWLPVFIYRSKNDIIAPQSEFNRMWYVFREWNTKDNGLWTWYNSWDVIVGTEDDFRFEILRLYAIWTPNVYNINYILNNWDYGDSHPSIVAYNQEFRVDAPNRTGYVFSGWKITGMDGEEHTYGNEVTSETSIASTKAMTFKNLHSTSWAIVTFNAQWNTAKYDVTFYSNGWTPVTTQNINYGSKATKPTDPFKEWYTLEWWLLNWNDFDFNTPITWNITLYAKREPIEYTIAYELNWWWVLSWENVTWYTIESEDITLIDPIKIWYTFIWRSGTDISGTSTSVIIPTWSTWDRVYEAVWRDGEYNLIFDSMCICIAIHKIYRVLAFFI